MPKTEHEEYLKDQGFNCVCGVDEVGRGAWAGPLVAGAVILNQRLYGLRDSKLLSSIQREKLSIKIKRSCRWGIGQVNVAELEELKMTKATQLAFMRAIEALNCQVDYILSDGFPVDSPISGRAIIKGDMKCSSIAAASIIAKVYRDHLMVKMDKKIIGYNFSSHKGYGTKLHQKALDQLGPSVVHRKFFKSIKF